MKESYWGYWLIVLGIFVILIMLLVQNVTATNTQDYYLAKEIAEAAMVDSVDYGYYREYGEVRIIKEKFVESFVRRFAESASLSSTYKIEFYELYEVPPKVSVKISTNSASFNIAGDASSFNIVNKVDMILEADPNFNYPESLDDGNYDKATTALKSIPNTERYVVKTGDNEYTIIDNTGQVFDKDCQVLTATFEKVEADKISYESFKCIPKDGKCDIYLPQIYKADGNVYGWNTAKGSKTNALKPGSKVTISSNTTYYAVTDESVIIAEAKFIKPSEGVSEISSTSLSCTIKASSNSCQIKLPTLTTSKGYEFNGWSTSKDGSSGLLAAGTSVTFYRANGDVTVNYYPILTKVVVPTPTPTPEPTPTVDICNDDNIYTATKVDGDPTNATAWPQYGKLTLLNESKGNTDRSIVAGTPMRILSCDSTYCKVWVKGDDCSTTYYAKKTQLLINLPDYIPSLHFGNKAVANQPSKKRRGLVLNRKFNEEMPIVPTRFVMADKLLKVQKNIQSQGKKENEEWSLYIDDLYRPVAAQGDPNYKSNVNCMYEACGISLHAFSGAVDVSLVWYTNGAWKKFDMPPWKGGSTVAANASKNQRKNYNILKNAMTGAGLKVYASEWWHFNEQSAVDDRNQINNYKSEWGKRKWMKWGAYAWVFDVELIDRAGSKYSYTNFLPKLFYE